MDAGLLCFLCGYVLVRRASLLDKLMCRRGGWRFLGWGTRPGWSGCLPLYERGGKVTYPQGYGEKLE